MSSEQDSVGPYTSPAMCVPSDLDVIASGVLPAMPDQQPPDNDHEGEVKDEQEKKKNDNVTKTAN